MWLDDVSQITCCMEEAIFCNVEMSFDLVNFIIWIYSQSGTICSFVEPFLTTYSTESSDFGNYEIHSIV